MYHKGRKNSSKLAEIIQRIIESQGPITFKRFMELALYHPEYGYYARQDFPIGARGDFVTSPHASPIFGGAIAEQLWEMWRILEINPFQVVEIGAGSGLLARDILSYLRDFIPEVYEAVSFHIIEPMDTLARRQKDALEGLKCQWHRRLDEFYGIEGCIFSNELLDAFPVHLIVKEEGTYWEIYVRNGRDGGFEEELREIKEGPLRSYCERYLHEVPVGYRTEVDLGMVQWLKEVSKAIERGFLLTIDYGFTRREYFHPNRNRGTLLSYKGQQVMEDVLSEPGARDITHHVNFGDLVDWGIQEGFEPVGFCNQWSFLASIGVEKVIERLFPQGLDPFSPALAGIKMLLLPQGMGDTHKFLVQSKGIAHPIELRGFRIQNKVKRLP